MLDIDLLGIIFTYEPELNNRLISKKWNFAFIKPSIRKWVITWNLLENDYEYIDKNILPISRWVRNLETETYEVLEPISGVNRLVEKVGNYPKFIKLYKELRDSLGYARIIPQNDMEYLCYVCGKHGDCDVIKFLVNSGERVNHNEILEGAIRNQSYEIFEMYVNSTGLRDEVAHIALNEHITIESYGNSRISRFISKLNIRRVDNFSEILYPRTYNLNSEMYLRGLIKLGFNFMKKLNFRYTWQKNFTFSKKCMKLMLKYGIYDDGVLNEIIASYLRIGNKNSLEMLDKLWFTTYLHRENLIQFCIRHEVVLNIDTFNWVNDHFNLGQSWLMSILVTPQIRTLPVILQCFRLLSNYNSIRMYKYMYNHQPEIEI